jgi:hypothetical protein
MIKKVFIIIFLIILGFFSINPIQSLGQQSYFLNTRFDWIRNILSYSSYYKDRLFIRSYPFPFWFNIYGRPTGYYNFSFKPLYLNFTGYPFNAYYVNRSFYFNPALYPPLEVPFYASYPFDIRPIPDAPLPEALHTSLVLVRKDSSGGVVLKYVRGETLHPEGTYVWKDQEIALPKQDGADDQQISAPSTLLFPKTDRIYVARAILDRSADKATIHIADSGYATMLYESESRIVIERPVIIDSSVVLAYINEELFLVWKEGNILKAVRSYDGENWSAPEDLFSLSDGVFSLWSKGDRIYLAYTSEGGLQINLTYTDGITFGPNLVASTQDPVKGLSVSTEGSYIYLAYATEKYIKIARGTIDDNFEAFHEVINVPSNDPNYKIHSVTIHSSPYGWALQYIASYLSPGGIEYTIFGRRSQDGLDYSGTSWTYNTSSNYLGPTCMTLTPTPMPWIVKTNDSGKEAEEVYNFVIVGDGFTYGEKEKFMDAAKGMRDNIINRAPFFYNKDLFNVWVVNTFSKDSGFDSSDTVDDKDTIFNGHRIPGTTMVSTERDGIRHAKRIITGEPYTRNFYGFALFNAEEGETVAIPPWDTHGVPLSIHRINSLPSIHEYIHTNSGGFAMGDHDRHNQSGKNVNKSFDSILDEMGAHNWQHWFVFEGPAKSRLIEVTDDYRTGLIEWVNSGEDKYRYHTTHFAYSEDPDSPHYVDALSLFNVGLWESELTDVEDLNSSKQYSALRACAMNSMLHHAQIFCPVCSEIIVKTLQKAAGIVDEDAGIFFDVAAFQRAPGVYLEFQARNKKICGAEDFPPAINPENLVEVNGHTIATSDISSYESEDWAVHLISRIDITPWVTPGTPATVIFKQRSPEDEETRIWLPGVQIVNERGARYPVQPVGEALIQRLHEKHAPECDYEYWDLSEGDLTLTFQPVLSSYSDIAITNGTFHPTSPEPTDTLTVNLEVANMGSTQIQDAVISVFFGIGGTAHALPDAELPRVTLMPGETVPLEVLWDLPSGWGNKDVTIWAIADITHAIVETNETNNRFDFDTVRIAPPGPFVCQDNELIMPRFRDENYACFDVRDMDQSAIEQMLEATTTRLLLYGSYAVIDCPVALLEACYDHIAFVNTIQHEAQTNNVGAGPVIVFDSPFTPNPWNLIYIGVYATKEDLEEDCGTGADACAFGYPYTGRIGITEKHLEPHSGTIGINEGETNYYYYNIQYPDDCHIAESHEYQHVIDRALLNQHQGWLEEMVTRLFVHPIKFIQMLCPDVQFYNIYKRSNGVITELTEPPDLYEINSYLPLDNFANYYANGDPCREAIIMQMNREAHDQGQTYLRKLFRLMRTESISTDEEVAHVILLASDNDPAVLTFLTENGCNP